MALIELKTKLKSLKYGGDRPGGGSSNQPYVTREIPEGDLPAKAGPDFLLRGGFLAPDAAARDVSRISQMLVDTKSPNGFEFIAKQNILSRTSVKTEASNGPAYEGSALNQGIYNPASTIAQVRVQGWTPTHLNLFGVDPIAIEPSGSAGSSPLSIIKYEDLINDQLGRGGYNIKSKEANRLFNILDNITNNSSSNNFNFEGINLNVGNSVLEYGGGPGSILGVGTTKIRFADQRTGNQNPEKTIKPLHFYGQDKSTGITIGIRQARSLRTGEDKAEKVNTLRPYGASSKYVNFLTTKGLGFTKSREGLIDFNNSSVIVGVGRATWENRFTDQKALYKGQAPLNDQNNFLTWTYQDFANITGSTPGKTGGIIDFRKTIIDNNPEELSSNPLDILFPGIEFPTSLSSKKRIISTSPSYAEKNIEQRINLGNPGARNRNRFSYSLSSEALDKITASPIFKADKPNHRGDRNDLVKFSIGIIQNDNSGNANYMHFRAFIDSFSDSYNAAWSDSQYVGRGDKFYNYTAFTRDINLSFTVYAQSKAELIPMYPKLNYLASTLAPDYSEGGFMRGNLARLTMGGYLYNQLGIIKSLTYDISNESTWEIGINKYGNYDSSVKELPHMIKVTSFTFTPIQEFIPRIATPGEQQNTRYIALSKDVGNENSNYKGEELGQY